MRCALLPYITRLLQEQTELQSLASELTTIHSAINHADKSVSWLLTRMQLWDITVGKGVCRTEKGIPPTPTQNPVAIEAKDSVFCAYVSL